MSDYRKDLSYGVWAFNYLSAIAKSAGMEHDKRVLFALKYISLKSRDQQAVKVMLGRTLKLIKKSPGYIRSQLNTTPFAKCPPPGLIDGEIKIGYVYDNIRKIKYPFGIRRYELNQHMLESGRCGAGKTTLLILILINLIRLAVPFLIFDFKRDYRSMIRYSRDFYVFNKNNFRFNPLIPPKGTEPVQWASIFTDIFFQNFYQGAATSAKNIFLDVLLKLYEQKSLITFNDVCNEFNRMLFDKNCPNNIKDSIRTIMVRAKPFNSIMGDTINCPGFVYQKAKTSYHARRAFARWCKAADKTEIPELKTMAKTIRNKIDGIVTYWTFSGISNASMEGFNNKIRWLIRQVYGFRDREYFKLKIFQLPEISSVKEI